MSKVLLVDTNVSSAPIFRYLCDLGHEVHVVGGNPDDYLAKVGNFYHDMDYSNYSELIKLTTTQRFDYVVPGCNDRSYQVCSRLATEFGYHGIDRPEVEAIINNKQLFREFSLNEGLPVPRIYPADAVPRDRALIVKPVDAYSGRGVTVVREFDAQAMDDAVAFAKSVSRLGACIVEDYVDGQLYSHSAFIESGRVIVDFVVEEHGTANSFVVDTSRVNFEFSQEVRDKLCGVITLLAERLKLGSGLLHTQFIQSGDKFWIIEVTRRCPGDLYSQLIELSTGFPYVAYYVCPFLGGGYPETIPLQRNDFVMRHTVSQSLESVLGSIEFTRGVCIKKWVPLCVAGDNLKGSPYGRAGIMFVLADSKAELDEIYHFTLSRKLYIIHP